MSDYTKLLDLNSDKPDPQKENDNNLVFSYKTLRNMIGFSGMLLPVILAFTTSHLEDDKKVEPSISDYYYTGNGDVLVVLLSVLGVFLITYNGYSWKEKLWTNLAAICGMGVAFSPTTTKYIRKSFSVHTSHLEVPEIFGIERHLIFAAVFFVSLAIISLVFFPKTNAISTTNDKGKRTPKAKRNIVYKICGWTMIGCVLLLLVYFVCKPIKEFVGDFPIIFVLEAVAVEAFAVSWLTKGETFWPDGEHYVMEAFRKAAGK